VKVKKALLRTTMQASQIDAVGSLLKDDLAIRTINAQQGE
jgi:hypothetical protein